MDLALNIINVASHFFLTTVITVIFQVFTNGLPKDGRMDGRTDVKGRIYTRQNQNQSRAVVQ